MSIEYQHYIVPQIPIFIPSINSIYYIDQVLKKWNLKVNEPKVCDFSSPNDIKPQKINEINKITNGIVIQYDQIEGNVVEEIFGSSFYGEEIVSEDRYIQNIYFLVGLDYRIQPFHDWMEVDILKPAYQNKLPLKYYEVEKFIDLFYYSFKADEETTPPEVKISTPSNYTGEFKGLWRSSLIIDFGKDIPELNKNETYFIKNKSFLDDIITAFGCNIFEIGKFY